MPSGKEPPVRLRMSDTLFTAIRATLDADLSRSYSNLVLYSTFGIVRGRISRAITDRLNIHNDDSLESSSRVLIQPDVLELEDCEVEHYSNHLPTAHIKKLYLRIDDIRAFAFDLIS